MISRVSLTAVAAATAALALACPALAGAQAPGSLDSSFNGSGVVTLGSGTQLFGVAVQPNGEIVAAGQSAGKVLVERFNTAGSPDGQYVGAAGVARGVAIQPDGKIVVAGSSGGAMFAERLTTGLQPDSSFGNGGIQTAFAGQSGAANAVAIEPDGSIVAAGSVGGPDTRVGVARFTSNGGLIWAVVPGFGDYSVVEGIAIQPADGKIVFVGQQTPLQSTDALIGRLNTDGSLDGSFTNGGVFTYHYPGGGYTGLSAVTIQNDGRIVAAGIDIGGPNAIFLRLNANGSFDQSFGSGGVAALPSGKAISVPGSSNAGAYGVGIAGGGRIVGTGLFDSSNLFSAAAWALTTGGSAEGAFGSGGTVTGPDHDESCAMAIAPDGSIVSVGDSVPGSDSGPCTFNNSSSAFVARYIGFGPPPPPSPSTGLPTASTGSAGAITQVTAMLSGSVNPNGLATSYHFEYGTSTSYGSSSSAGELAAGHAALPVSQLVAFLKPGTTYHYRLVASNADGTSAGGDATFRTAPGRGPSASTGMATGVGEVSVLLNGALNPEGLATSYSFQYGRTTTYGSSTRGQTATGASSASVSARVTGLLPHTTYHYRLVATNGDGTSYGNDRTFTTAPRLIVGLTGVAKTYKISVARTQGLSLTVRCSQGCSITGSMLISAATARRLKLGTQQLTSARGSAKLTRAGRARLVLRLTSRASSAVARVTGLGATLRIVVKPAGGGPKVTKSQTITLTR